MNDSDGGHGICCMKNETLQQELNDPEPWILKLACEVTDPRCI